MARHIISQSPTSFPTRVHRDGLNVNRAPDLEMPVGSCLNSHCEWHDSKTMLPTEKPEYASDDDYGGY